MIEEFIQECAERLELILAPIGVKVVGRRRIIDEQFCDWVAEFRFTFDDQTQEPAVRLGEIMSFPSWRLSNADAAIFERQLPEIASRFVCHLIRNFAVRAEKALQPTSQSPPTPC